MKTKNQVGDAFLSCRTGGWREARLMKTKIQVGDAFLS
jgi:hypothetical protein